MPNEFFHTPNWAKTDQQSTIALYHSHPLNALESLSPLVFVGGVHGDEPEGIYLAEELLTRLKQLKTRKSWALVTCINPDGQKLGQRTNGNGVDLNRNFPTADWQLSDKGGRYYSGPAAGSEKETQALMSLFSQVSPTCVFHFHSWQPCVVYTGEAGKIYGEHLSGPFHPAKPDIGYPTPGSLGHYGWQEKKTPVVCVEEREGASRQEVWSNFGEKLLDLLRYPKLENLDSRG